MIGALLGDMIGAPYEFDRSDKTKDFPLFSKYSEFTDDSVMTIAVAEALLDTLGQSNENITAALVTSMQKWGKKYPNAGYGGMFFHWLYEKNPKPYDSFGNGSAMRVSPAGWLFNDMETTRHMAALTASVSHNHPEGIKGAEAVASAIFLARTGSSKEEIKKYIINEFGYDISRSCDEIRPGYHHVETCQETVPEAITAFLEGQNFEDVIRTAVSLGGDCDTLTDIAGSIAEAFYGILDEIAAECRKRLPKDINAVIDRFNKQKIPAMPPFQKAFLNGNELIEAAIAEYYNEDSKKKRTAVLDAIRQRMHEDGHFLIPIIVNEKDENQFTFRTIQTNDEKLWHVVFTSHNELAKRENSTVISHSIDSVLQFCLQTEAIGYIINPWGQPFLLTKELIQMIYEADDDVEYTVPDEPITEELLEGGSFLKNAIEICNRNRTQLNLIKLARILRDSLVWVPCNMMMSAKDYKTWSKAVLEAADKGDMDSLIGQKFTVNDNIRMIPDILQNGDTFFFPVFTSDEAMGEYGKQFSKIQLHFLEAMNFARNNEKNVCGIVINAFSESFVIPVEIFDIIAEMDSSIERKESYHENDKNNRQRADQGQT